MMKNYLSRLSALAVLTVALAACKQQADYTQVIPADAAMVTSIDQKTLTEKAGLTGEENTALTQQMLDAMKNEMSATAFQQLEKIVKNPAESGIDTNAPTYIFAPSSFDMAAVVAKVADESALTATIEVLVKEQAAQPIAKEANYSYTTIGNIVLAFNQSAALLAIPYDDSKAEACKTTVSTLMGQPAANSIHQSEAFKKMSACTGDIKYLVSVEAIASVYKKMKIDFPIAKQMKELFAYGDICFDKGEIRANLFTYTDNKETEAYMEEQWKVYKKPAEAFNKLIPANALLYTTTSIDGAKLCEQAVKQYEQLTQIYQSRKGSPEAVIAEASLDLAKDENVQALLSSIDGDVTLSVPNVANNMPTIVAYAQVKDPSAIEKLYNSPLLKDIKTGKFVELNKNEYAYQFSQGFLSLNIYFGVKGNTMYITNDENTYRNFGQEVQDNINQAPYASAMKGKTAYGVVNVDAILNLPIVKMMAGMGGAKIQRIVDLLAKISYIDSSSEKQQSSCTIHLTDKETNALKQIVDTGKQLAGM